MAWATSTVLTYATLAASVAGAGVSAYSSYQQGKSQKAAANYNYMLQMQQARAAQSQQQYQVAAMKQQASLTQQQAAINNAMAQAEAQARFTNEQMLRNKALADAANQQDNIRKTRLDQERMQAIQRARIAGSGVVESGSPLEILAESAGEMEQQLNEMHYQSNLDYSNTMRQADLERFGGELASAGAYADLGLANAEASLMRASAQAERLKGDSQYRAGVLSANIDRKTGMAQASAYKTQAWGSLLSGVGSAGGQWSNWKYKTA